MFKIRVTTKQREEIVNITPSLQQLASTENLKSGLMVVYSPHTTAGITVNENADPDVKRDILHFLKKAVPYDFDFAHMEGNSDAHIKGSLTGFSQTFIVENGKLQLGTWQGIFFMEFDGPRSREVWCKFIAG